MTGGYSLIDCFDVNITSEPVKIEGIFKKYQTSKRKAFLLSNVTINNTQLNDVFSTPYFEDGKVCFPAYDGVIKISDTDYVNFDVTADVIADKYLSKEDFLTIESDNAPYVSRTARDGLVKIPQLVGATVAWNQLVQNGDFADGISNWDKFRGAIAVSNNILTYTVLDVGSFIGANRLIQDISFNSSHKYIVRADIKASKNYDFAYRFVVNNGADRIAANHFSLTTSWQTCILTTTTTTLLSSDVGHSIWLCPYSDNMAVGDTIDFRNIQLFDLTQMFGTAIADYVYSLEQATEGSGIAWLKSYGFFTKDYYEYDAGSLQSVCTSARKITSLDGTVRTYPIDNEELRGLFKLDANNKLYADGDIYPPSGSGTRKYGIVDLGSLTYVKNNISSSFNTITFSAVINDYKTKSKNRISSIYMNTYQNGAANVASEIGADADKFMLNSNASSPIIYFVNRAYENSTAEDFKTAMSGQYLVYELAEETTFSADPYINPQRSEGTEEFIDGLTRDVMIPVGNNSTYYKDELFNIIGEYIDSCDDAVIAMIPEGE